MSLRKKLKEFLSGKDNSKGKALYDAWYKSFDDTGASAEDPVPGDIERELADIKSRELKQNRGLRTLDRGPIYWRAAAAILLLTAVGIGLYVGSFSSAFQRPVQYAEHTTSKGQRLEIKLTDGSTVWLNADTKLRAPEEFDNDTREVFLEGEAYFDVAHDPKKPFIIHAGHVTTTVLGTAFNVRNYANQVPEVAVVSGKVSVRYDSTEGAVGAEVILQRGERAQVAPIGIVSDVFHDFERYETWKDGRLVFDDQAVRDVLLTVSRFYGVDIRVKDPGLGACRISTTLESMTEQEVVDLLCLLLKATAEKRNNVYWISGNGCN